MSTVNHVRLSNIFAGDTSPFITIWTLTRAMKKAGWKFKGSSDGTTFTTGSDPELDQWGAGTVSNTGGAAASIVTPANGRAQVNGLTGIVAADKGRFLKISGSVAANNHYHQIEEIVSATQVKIDARNFAVVAAAGPLTWDIRDPLGNTYPVGTPTTTVAWWCAQGPSVLKIPITAASAGVFQRGENISQATTGATGEVLGYTYYNNTGWLVVAPRMRGTGTGVWGWQTTFVITGSKSAATVTQVGTAIDYVFEVVFAKTASQTAIQIFLGHFDSAAATAFSTLTPTAATHPGGGGASNVFPTHAWVAWGTGSAPGATNSLIVPTNGGMTNTNLICVDAIPEAGYSADGSWSAVLFNNSFGSTIFGSTVFGFHRLNDIEDGELSPYVSVMPFGTKTLYGNARTNSGGVSANGFDQLLFGYSDAVVSTASCAFAGWRARGLAAEAFVEFEIAALAYLQTALGFHITRLTNQSIRMQASASRVTKVRERMWLVNTTTPFVFTKGSLRWMYWVCGDQITDTYGTDPGWVQLASSGVGGTGATDEGGAAVLGPYDGTPWLIQRGD